MSEVRDAAPATIEAVWRERWGLPVVTARRNYGPADVEGLELAGERRGLVTWRVEGDLAEIVTLDALTPGRGDGSRLLAAAEERLAARGVRRLRVTTTNDNLRAVAFYAKRGWRLLRVHRDALDEVRRLKPQVPLTGQDGIPLQDLLELDKALAPGGPGEAHQQLTILAVTDVARAVRFYRAAFGWPVRAEVPVYTELELPDGRGIGLYLASAFGANTGENAAPPPASGTTATELYFYVDDVRAMTRRLEEAGGRLLSPAARRPWGDEVAYAADPDGNVVAVALPHPPDEKG